MKVKINNVTVELDRYHKENDDNVKSKEISVNEKIPPCMCFCFECICPRK